MSLRLAHHEPERIAASDSREKRFEFQCRMLEKGLEQIQLQIGRLDDITFRIQAGAATVWAALIGWSVTGDASRLTLIGFVVILGFWLLEAMFRGVQARYMERSHELCVFLNDADALDECFDRREFPEASVYPVGLRESEWKSLSRFLRALVSSRVATLYLFLGLANLLAWLALDLILAGAQR